MESLNINQITAVLAHELGHLHHKHILKMLVKSIFMLLIGLYVFNYILKENLINKVFGVESVPVGLALVYLTLYLPYLLYPLTPISSLSSRRKEFEADRFAVKHSSAEDLKTALIKLHKDNSSTLTPHPWYSKFYYSHPPVIERIKAIDS